MKKVLILISALSYCLIVYAGGSPEHVDFPTDYKSEFIQYDTRNRNNGKQVAVMYANQVAMDSVTSDRIAPGSIVVMEIYKTITGQEGKPKTGADGIFEKGPLAAVAVMEKRADWPTGFASSERAGDWGFAIYQVDETPKANDLDCVSCHRPLSNNDYLFSYSSLKKFSL